MSYFKVWDLREAKVGDLVWVGGHRRIGLHAVTAANKTRVTLTDGTVWSRSGILFGHASGFSYGRPHASLVTNIPAARTRFAEIDAKQRLETRRENVANWIRLKCTTLTDAQLTAIEAVMKKPAP